MASAIPVPLLKALQSLSSSLTWDDNTRLLVAAKTERMMRRQDLPDHIRITSRPLKGARVKVRKPRNSPLLNLIHAYWPEDHMNEGTYPCLLGVSSGAADIFLGNYILHCQRGDFIYVPVNVPKGDFLSNIADKNPQHSCDIVYITPDHLLGQGLACILSSSQGDKSPQKGTPNSGLIKSTFMASLFEQLRDEASSVRISPLTLHILRALIFFIAREIERGNMFQAPTVRSGDRSVDRERRRHPIKYALAYIEDHLDQHLTIESMSRLVALSPTDFKRHFRDYAGTTFHRCLTKKRIALAETLLCDTNLSVEEVGRHVGLKRVQLGKYIHQKHGCAPAAYRRRKNMSESDS